VCVCVVCVCVLCVCVCGVCVCVWPVKPYEWTDELMCLAEGGASSSHRHLMTKMVQLLCKRHYRVRTSVI